MSGGKHANEQERNLITFPQVTPLTATVCLLSSHAEALSCVRYELNSIYQAVFSKCGLHFLFSAKAIRK